MKIPDAAIEAAAAEYARVYCTRGHESPIRAALEAAMPAIREALAQEIHARACQDPADVSEWDDGMFAAARIVREGYKP